MLWDYVPGFWYSNHAPAAPASKAPRCTGRIPSSFLFTDTSRKTFLFCAEAQTWTTSAIRRSAHCRATGLPLKNSCMSQKQNYEITRNASLGIPNNHTHRKKSIPFGWNIIAIASCKRGNSKGSNGMESNCVTVRSGSRCLWNNHKLQSWLRPVRDWKSMKEPFLKSLNWENARIKLTCIRRIRYIHPYPNHSKYISMQSYAYMRSLKKHLLCTRFHHSLWKAHAHAHTKKRIKQLWFAILITITIHHPRQLPVQRVKHRSSLACGWELEVFNSHRLVLAWGRAIPAALHRQGNMPTRSYKSQ